MKNSIAFSWPRRAVAAAFVLGTAFAAGPVLAGAGDITTLVTPIQANVTYSISGATPLVTYIGYKVSVANAGGNTVNDIRFTGQVKMTDLAEKATFVSAEGANCWTVNNPGTTTNDGTSIQCSIGQLKAGVPFPTFAVFFKAPAKITNGVADDVVPDFVKDYAAFDGKLYYAEGSGGEPQSTPSNSIYDWTTGLVKLGTFNPEEVKSAVPKGIAKYVAYTGDAAISRSNDKFTTRVEVPALSQYTTVEILESQFSLVCASFYSCDQTQITIPLPVLTTFSPYLTIVLRQDASNIRPGTKIGNVLIDYVDSDNVVHQNIGDCASATTPRSDYLPCIAKRTYYKNSSVQGWTADLDGDFEWTIITLKNGGYRFPS